MSFSVNTNINAMTANMNLNRSDQAVNSSLGSLSSGLKLNSASDDASSLSIADQLSAQVSGMGQAMMNANDSVGMIQIADGGMSSISENMDRIRVLTLQASNGTMNDASREAIQKEIDGLLKSSDQIANSTSYNGIDLLNGTTLTTQSGANAGDTQTLEIGDATMTSLLGGSIDVTTEEGLASALETIDKAMDGIHDIRSSLGSSENQLVSTINSLSVTQINTASAESQLRDVDFAAESANFSKENMMSQIGSYVQAQSNAVESNVARLFQ